MVDMLSEKAVEFINQLDKRHVGGKFAAKTKLLIVKKMKVR